MLYYFEDFGNHINIIGINYLGDSSINSTVTVFDEPQIYYPMVNPPKSINRYAATRGGILKLT